MAETMTPDAFLSWRKSLGLTQAQAAERLGVGKRSVWTYETTGPVPQAVALACAWLARQPLTVEDMERLVREQFPNVGTEMIVLPYVVERGSAFSRVLETRFSAETLDWLSTNAPSARLSMKTIVTPDRERRLVPIVEFDNPRDAVFFKLALA